MRGREGTKQLPVIGFTCPVGRRPGGLGRMQARPCEHLLLLEGYTSKLTVTGAYPAWRDLIISKFLKAGLFVRLSVCSSDQSRNLCIYANFVLPVLDPNIIGKQVYLGNIWYYLGNKYCLSRGKK